MGMNVGTHFSVKEVASPKAYKVTTGDKHLSALEDGEAVCAWPESHIITLHEETGHVIIEGIYGHFSYCWPAANRGEGYSLQGFLYGLSFDYFMGKTMKGHYMIPDIQKTHEGYQRDLLQERRNGEIDKCRARDVWERLEEIPSDCFENEFVIYLSNDPVLNEMYLDGPPSIQMREDPLARNFWDNVWVPFKESVLKPYALQDEIERKSRTANAA